MAGINDIFVFMGYTAPLTSSLMCGLVMILYCAGVKNGVEKKICRLLIVTYSLSVFCWLSLLLYTITPALFVYVQSLAYLCMLGTQVLIFRFIYILTSTANRERFSAIHYAAPLLITGTLFIWSFFVPVEAQLYIVESHGKSPEGYEAYTALFTSKIPVLLLYTMIYAAFGLRRIGLYSRFIGNYSADEGHSSVKWIYRLLYIMLATLPITLVPVFFGKDTLDASLIVIFPVFMTVFQDVIICYNVVAHNFVIPSSLNEQPDGDLQACSACQKLTRERFEQYMQTHKPYLNPQLRITDILPTLGTNRTYLSNFINSEYGMNFSRYMNRLRLAELNSLKLDPAFSRLNGMELLLHAGFSNYRGYLRVKKSEGEVAIKKK